MSRYGRNPSYSHHIENIGDDTYVISWTVDFYYASSRLRHPRRFERVTDGMGARRFARKHDLTMPEEAKK